MMTPTQAKPRGVTASFLAGAVDREHPDAELLAAWEQWLATYRHSYADRVSSETHFATLDQLDAVVAGRPAQTAAGIAVKLKIAFHNLIESTRVDSEASAQNGQPTPAMLADYRQRLLWSAIEDLERMAAA